jgi:hypothetical protein
MRESGLWNLFEKTANAQSAICASLLRKHSRSTPPKTYRQKEKIKDR